MKKNNSYIIYAVVAFVGLLLFSFLISTVGDSETKFNEITINEYLSITEAEGRHIVYIGDPRCSFCELLEPILVDVQNDLNVTINYVNLQNYSNEDFSLLRDSHPILSEGFGTPLLMIFSNGEVEDYHEGYAEYDVIRNFMEQ